MPINMNRFEPGALAALAGNSFPNLHLPVAKYDPSGYGQAMFQGLLANQQNQQAYDQMAQQGALEQFKQGQMNERDAAQQQADLYKTLLTEQGQNNRSQNRDAILTRGQDISAQRYGQMNQMDAAKLGLEQQKTALYGQQIQGQMANIDLEKQKMMQEMALKQMEMKMKMEAPVLAKRAQLSSSILQEGAQYADDPAKLKAFYDSQAALYKDQGAMSDEEYKTFTGLDAQHQTAALKLEAMNSEAAMKGQMQLGQQVSQNPELVKELNKQQATQAGESYNLRKQINTFLTFNENAKQDLEQVPGYALGPIATSIKLDKMDPRAQKLNSSLSSMMLVAKDMLGLKGGAQGMTEGEWEMVKSVAGGTFQNKSTLQQVLETMNNVAIKVQRREWENENNIYSQAGGTIYQSWKAANPEPPTLQLYKLQQANPNVPVEVLKEYISQ